MYKKLCPDMRVHSIYQIDLDKLRAMGIRGIIFDLDNTLIEWDNDRPAPEMIAWIQKVKDSGFLVCLLSNNTSYRVERIALQLNVPFFAPARKPLLPAFHRALKSLGLCPVDTAMVGDQLFTDVLGGNRLGMYTIWVTPMSSKEFFGTRITRAIERVVVRHLISKGMLKV